jgi:hypothetical protein
VHRIEGMLADWHRLYKELGAARARLARIDGTTHRERGELEAEVVRKKNESDAALHAVQAALGAATSARTSQGNRQGGHESRAPGEAGSNREGPSRV